MQMPRVHFVSDKNFAKAIPRDIAIDDSDDKIRMMKELQESRLSPFYKRNMKDIWICSLSLGYNSGEREKISSTARRIPVSALSATDFAVVVSVAVAEMGDIEFLITEKAKQVFSIAEEYANAGLDELYFLVFGEDPGEPLEKIYSTFVG